MQNTVVAEHVDVLIVGAGLSGIGAGHYVKTACPWASFAILEGRDSIGGTWDLFRYPGVRSDSDMFTLGYSFRPWESDKAIADGPAILQYIKDTAAADDLYENIRLRQRVVAADWSGDDALWHVTVEVGATGERVEMTCRFLFSCTGYYRYDHGYLPDFEGTDRFGGTIVHPQFWPEDLDYAGKKVVVIGSGATAVTLVPSLARTAGHVTMLQRSPTYIASMPSRNPIADALRRYLPERYRHKAIRWLHALFTQASFQASRRWPKFMKRMLRKAVERELPAGYDVERHFTPTYNPWDQRLCVVPEGDLFKAISAGQASVVTDRISTFTENGLLLESGAELDADIIITATGLDLLFMGGIDLRVDGEPVNVADKLVYKGMMLEGVPNLAIAVGYTNASWTLKCDLTCQYVTRLLNHLHATGLRQCTPTNSDGDVSPEPLLGLNSGYVQRSMHLFPKQGSRAPWLVHQSYLKDYLALQRSGLHDNAMVFSNPSPSAERRSAPAALAS